MTPRDALAALEAQADPDRATQMRAYHKIDRPYLGLSNETCNALAADWRKALTLEDRLALADLAFPVIRLQPAVRREYLAANGLNTTQQRELIVDSFLRSRDHISIDVDHA